MRIIRLSMGHPELQRTITGSIDYNAAGMSFEENGLDGKIGHDDTAVMLFHAMKFMH